MSDKLKALKDRLEKALVFHGPNGYGYGQIARDAIAYAAELERQISAGPTRPIRFPLGQDGRCRVVDTRALVREREMLATERGIRGMAEYAGVAEWGLKRRG